MMKRTRAYRRQQRQRAIRKKLDILQRILHVERLPIVGKLSKGKVHCSCNVCRYEQRYRIPKAKEHALWQAHQQQLNE